MNALVTGGTGGIGTEICKSLNKQGYNVVALTHPADPGIEAWKQRIKDEKLEFGLVLADVSDFDECVRLKESFNRSYGKLSVLVNGAGITRDGLMKKMSSEMWDMVITTNLNSMFYVAKNFINDMIEENFGRIVNIASINAHKGQFGQTNYSAAKAGVLGFTKSLASETAIHGITVNSVSPGYTETPMVTGMKPEVLDSIIKSHVLTSS